jgi:AraC family transcriptional regulator
VVTGVNRVLWGLTGMHTHTRATLASPPTAPQEAVPSSVVCSSAPLGWHGIVVWRRQSPPTTVVLPPLTMHDVVLQLRAGPRLIQDRDGRRHEGPWRKGDILIVPAGRPSAWTIEGPVDNLHLSLDPGFVRRVALEACGMPPAHVEIRDVFSGRDPEIACLGHRLLRELTTAGLGGLVYAESLATLLALHLLRTYGVQPPRLCSHTGGLSPHKLRLVQEYIHAHLDQPLGLADLAALVQLSTPHFLRMFKQSTGQAPHQYVLAQRIERAKAYLRTSMLCMTEIALRLGFRTQSHFTMHFRRLTGLTPTAYRHAHGVHGSPCSAPARDPRYKPGERDGSAAHSVS